MPISANKYQIIPMVFQTGTELDKKYVLKVADMPASDRPREKLLGSGPKNLNLTELLAIIINSGTKKEEVMSMASRLLAEYGEKNITKQTDPQVLAKEMDLPLVKACQLVACFELGRRLWQKKSAGLTTIRSAKDVYDYLLDMRNLAKEQVRALYLNQHYQLIHDEVVSLGTAGASIFDAKEVFKPAIQYGASAVVLAHNHPSGKLGASDADKQITEQLRQAGEILGIEFIDHVIIGQNKYNSLMA